MNDGTYIVKWTLIISGWISFIGGLVTPTIITLQGTLFTTQELSLLMVIPAAFKMMQIFANRIPKYVGLMAPIIFDVLSAVLSFIIIFAFDLKYYVAIEMIIGSIAMLLYLNRSGIVIEYIKDVISYRRFNNIRGTVASISASCGFLVSYATHMSPSHVIVFTWVLAMLPIPHMIKISKIILRGADKKE